MGFYKALLSLGKAFPPLFSRWGILFLEGFPFGGRGCDGGLFLHAETDSFERLVFYSTLVIGERLDDTVSSVASVDVFRSPVVDVKATRSCFNRDFLVNEHLYESFSFVLAQSGVLSARNGHVVHNI